MCVCLDSPCPTTSTYTIILYQPFNNNRYVDLYQGSAATVAVDKNKEDSNKAGKEKGRRRDRKRDSGGREELEVAVSESVSESEREGSQGPFLAPYQGMYAMRNKDRGGFLAQLCGDFRTRVDALQMGPLLSSMHSSTGEVDRQKGEREGCVAPASTAAVAAAIEDTIKEQQEARHREEREEAKLRAEIETLEWQSSAEYKGTDAKRRRNLTSKRAKLDKILYNKEATNAPYNMPLTMEDLCGPAPPAHRARAIGQCLEHRMLVVCTAEEGLGVPAPAAPEAASALSGYVPEGGLLQPFDGDEGRLLQSFDVDGQTQIQGQYRYGGGGDFFAAFDTAAQEEGQGRYGGGEGPSFFEAFDMAAQEEAWGRQSCEDVAHTYSNGPVISLQALLDEDEEAASESGAEAEGGVYERDSCYEFDPVWSEATRRRHAKLAVVVEQWLRMLSSERFGYL